MKDSKNACQVEKEAYEAPEGAWGANRVPVLPLLSRLRVPGA